MMDAVKMEEGRGGEASTPLATCDVNLEVGKDKRGKVGNETIAYKMYIQYCNLSRSYRGNRGKLCTLARLREYLNIF